MNWKIGQKLVCINPYGWTDTDLNIPNPHGPRYKDIVIFDGMHDDRHIYLVGYIRMDDHYGREAYDKKEFVPINTISATSELIEKFVEVEEKSDCPIQVPETV